MNRGSALFPPFVALLSAGIAGVGVYTWQRARLDRIRDQLERTKAVTEVATKDQAALSEEVTELGTRVDDLRKRRLAAKEDARGHQDCVALSSNQNQVGSQTVVFGFPHVSNDEGNQLLIDEAEWLSGAEANEAAMEDGVIEAGESVPNDYYNPNEDRARVAMPVADDVVIVLTTADRNNIPSLKCVSWREFDDTMRNPRPWEHAVGQSPFWLTVQNGEMIRIVEQYLP
jgi:hypothetical protein